MASETDASRTTLNDLGMQARIRAQLREAPETAKVDITVAVSNGQVRLSGIVGTREEYQRAEQFAARASGAASVDNQLRIARARDALHSTSWRKTKTGGGTHSVAACRTVTMR